MLDCLKSKANPQWIGLFLCKKRGYVVDFRNVVVSNGAR